MNDIYILYSTGCPRCETLKRILNTKGINYSVVTDTNEMLDLEFSEVPMLRINECIMNYDKAIKYLKSLTN